MPAMSDNRPEGPSHPTLKAALLMIGDWTTIALATTTAAIGVICLAASLHGWIFGKARMWQRALFLAAALLLIKPGLYTDLAGLALIAVGSLGGRFVPQAKTEA